MQESHQILTIFNGSLQHECFQYTEASNKEGGASGISALPEGSVFWYVVFTDFQKTQTEKIWV